MSACYTMSIIRDELDHQTEAIKSHIGGRPSLPPEIEIPTCDLCGSSQTFYAQVAFPDDHDWHDLTLALFSCTSCRGCGHVIPEMLSGRLRGIDIPRGFLESYQLNFRFLVSETNRCRIRNSYVEKVKFKRVELVRRENSHVEDYKVGGNPNWLLNDYTPGTYAGSVNMIFLLQFLEDYQFETVSGAPRQMFLDLFGQPRPSQYAHYDLFLGNALYLFGTADRNQPLVYAITQTY